jgi:hypothetical protein
MGQRAAESGARDLEKLVELLDSIEDQLAALVGTVQGHASAPGNSNNRWDDYVHPQAHAELETARG